MKEEPTDSRLILLVEDDPNDVRLIQRALRKGGLLNPIEVARDGGRALDYLLGHGEYADRDRYPLPVLILLDLKLPKYSGHEVLEKLKTQPVLRRIPVVMLTSSEDSRDINRAYDLGANSYLVKPVRFDGFIKVAQEIHMYWLLLNETPVPRE